VLSFLFKNHPIGLLYDLDLSGRIVLISFMTVAELERWAVQYRWREHRLHWLHVYLNRITAVDPRHGRKVRDLSGVSTAAQFTQWVTTAFAANTCG
jgi:hypothetical protein